MPDAPVIRMIEDPGSDYAHGRITLSRLLQQAYGAAPDDRIVVQEEDIVAALL
jgi:hypothetical protein